MTARAGSGKVHVVGGGLAGLAAAVALMQAGRPVRLYEASAHAGGRCRSYFDAGLGCRLDNGNHLLLSGNKRALAYLEAIGAKHTLEDARQAAFPFFDALSRQRWVLRPNRGRLPWWILHPSRRVPGTRPADYLEALALRKAAPSARVAEVLDRTRPLFARLWMPLAVAALNTGVEEASAELFWRVLAETLGRGGDACRPLMPRDGLSETFVDPALDTLRRGGAAVFFGARLRGLDFADEEVRGLRFDTGAVDLAADEQVVLATPALVAARLVPGLTVPDRYAPIVNAHFRYGIAAPAPAFIGVIAGTAEWIFRKREVVSVTVSAAERIVDRSPEELAALLWRDTAAAYALPATPLPSSRIVKERRATFLAEPAQLLRRPQLATRWRNLVLAGDYTHTGLPATIEGAIASGFAAAARLLRRHGGCESESESKSGPRRSPAVPVMGRKQQRLLVECLTD